MKLEKDTRLFGVPWEDYPYVQASRVGETLYLSGQIAHDESGEIVGIGDMAAQMRQAYRNIGRLLAEYGASFDQIVDEMTFVTDMEAALACATEVRRDAYGGDPVVTSTLLQVAGLAFPDLLVEIRCTARLA
ncbi:MAG: RidA family protein [Myxococcales bacterium]|nr:RidA family protein [Myxococcales bacterium]